MVPRLHASLHEKIQKEGSQKMNSDKVTVDREQLLRLLVEVENALMEIKRMKQQLKGENP